MSKIKIVLFLFLAFGSTAHSKEDSLTNLVQQLSDLTNIVKNLQQENIVLQKQVELLNKRSIEDDIMEIKEILSGYGEDITDLRILQGHSEEAIRQHDTHLETVDTRLANHDLTFLQHQEFMNENRDLIATQSQTVSEHTRLIQENTDQITTQASIIANNAATIEDNIRRIEKSEVDIQSLSDNYYNYRNSQVKFYVETPHSGDLGMWPDNSRITYAAKHIDTHNAVNDGQFTAPISGLYAFVFTADFRQNSKGLGRTVNVNINDGFSGRSFYNDIQGVDPYIVQTFSAYFAVQLNQGDRLDLSTGYSCFDVNSNPAFWLGYLIQ